MAPLPKIKFPPPLQPPSRLPEMMDVPPQIMTIPVVTSSGLVLGPAISPGVKQLTLQAGSVVASTDGGGGVTFFYPTPFKSFILSVIVTPGDDASNLGMIRVQMANAGTTLASVHVQCVAANNTNIVNSGVRLNWIALGN